MYATTRELFKRHSIESVSKREQKMAKRVSKGVFAINFQMRLKRTKKHVYEKSEDRSGGKIFNSTSHGRENER